MKDIQRKVDKWAKENPAEYEEAKQAGQRLTKRRRITEQETD